MTTARIPVRLDPDMADLVPGYLERRRAEIDWFGKRLEARDWKAIEVAAHKVAGSAGGYGFEQLGLLARALEHAAIKQDVGAIIVKLQALTEHVAAIDLVP